MNLEYIQSDMNDLVRVLSELQENYSDETQEYFNRAIDLANELSILVERINFLTQDEESEESFIQGIEECMEHRYKELNF